MERIVHLDWRMQRTYCALGLITTLSGLAACQSAPSESTVTASSSHQRCVPDCRAYAELNPEHPIDCEALCVDASDSAETQKAKLIGQILQEEAKCPFLYSPNQLEDDPNEIDVATIRSRNWGILLIDMQVGYFPYLNNDSFMQGDGCRVGRAIQHMAWVIEYANLSGIPVVVAEVVFSDPAEQQTIEPLRTLVERNPRHVYVEKTSADAFASGELQTVLDELGVDALVLGGANDFACARASLQSAAELGYSTITARNFVTNAFIDDMTEEGYQLYDELSLHYLKNIGVILPTIQYAPPNRPDAGSVSVPH